MYNSRLQAGGQKIVCAKNAFTLSNHERHAVLREAFL